MNVRSVARTSLAALALSTGSLFAAPSLHAQFSLSMNVGYARTAPPPLMEVDQPMAPGDGYIWTPGYWAWDDDAQDYYWVEGEWVMAPEPGLLWTPGYWAYDNGGYRWNNGYWGEHVGFYGGVNYGFGYFGSGYDGGYWNGNRFYYNTAVNRIDLRYIRNTYQRPVAYPLRGGHIAFNGGPGGINMRPSRNDDMAFRDRHFQPTQDQQRGWQQARNGRESGGWDGSRNNNWNSRGNGWDGNRNSNSGDRNGFSGDRGGWNGRDNRDDRDRSNPGWNNPGGNGFRNNGNDNRNQPPQPGNGQNGGWRGRDNGGSNQPGNGQGNGWPSRGNGGSQQPPVTTQPNPGGNNGNIRWNGPGNGNNRLEPRPPVARPFPPEMRDNGGNRGNQPPFGNSGGNRDGGGQQPPRSQGGGNFMGAGGDRPSFNRGNAPQQPSGLRNFGRF